MKTIGCSLFVLISVLGFGQSGGLNTLDFLQLVQPARISAIGGANLSVFDGDANMTGFNPGLLNGRMHDKVALNFVDYFAGINYGNVSYTYGIDTVVDRVAQVNLMNANYGTMQYADATGQLTGGSFTANDAVLNLSYAQQLSKQIRGGVTMKFIYSAIESYQAFGVACDLGASYYNEEKEFSMGFSVLNIGPNISYSDNGARESLPTQVLFGFSKKLKYAPFRLSVTFENLQKWDLTVQNPNLTPQTDPLTGELIPLKQPGFLDKAMRHVVIGGEILLTKNFHIRTGFNYRRMRELSLAARPGLVGMSLGLGFRINRFHLSYARSSYHRAGGTNSISILTRIGDFRSKR